MGLIIGLGYGGQQGGYGGQQGGYQQGGFAPQGCYGGGYGGGYGGQQY